MRKGIVRRLTGFVLASVLSIGMFLPSLLVKAAETESLDWMSRVDGEAKISEISIPGTHDSATQYIWPSYFLQCQDTDFSTMLENGYRYLDIRLSLDEKKDGTTVLKFIHNFGTCRRGESLFSDDLLLSDCLDSVYSFLEEHPTETVIFNVKDENSDDDPTAFQTAFYDVIDENPSMWYTDNSIPTLDEVRGKIVLCTRFDDVQGLGNSRTGLHLQWSEQNNKEVSEDTYEVTMINDSEYLAVQDHYKYNQEVKFEAVEEMLFDCQASENTLSLNFCSTSGSGTLAHPSAYAKYINAALLDTELSSGTCYGVVIVDFADEELARHIYETNY